MIWIIMTNYTRAQNAYFTQQFIFLDFIIWYMFTI